MTIAILGGGLAGLSAAYYLKREGNIKTDQTIQIIEANNNTGGWIQSQTNEKSKIVTELGPRTIRGRGNSANNTYNLIKDLGIKNLVRHVDIDASTRYIFAKGNVHTLPSNFWKALFLVNQPFTRPWIYYVLREFFSLNNGDTKLSEVQNTDESAYDFFSRTYGQEFADYLISPLLCGVCGGHAKEISIKFMFGALYEAEQKHGSVGFGLLKEKLNTYWTCEKVKRSEETYNFEPPPSVYYLEGGLHGLINALHSEIEYQGIVIKLNTLCTEINFHENGGIRIMLSNGQHMECSHVISALPSHKLATCINSQHSTLTQLLNSIPTVSIATVNFTYDNPNVMDSYKGFGILSSPFENSSLLGIIFNNCIYGYRESVDITVMMGGYAFKDNFVHNSKCLSNDKLTNIALDHVKRVLNIKLSPTTCNTQVLHNCIPQYTIGHYDRVTKIQNYITSRHLPLTLVGSSYTGISINDVIYSSMIAMRKFCRYK